MAGEQSDRAPGLRSQRSPRGWAAAAAIAVLLSAPTGRAAQYNTLVEIDTEEDLQDLLASGEIEQAEYDQLLEILEEGVDLNTADREDLYSLPNLNYHDVDAILAYRDEAGNIDDPTSLISAGVISPEKLAAIAAFILVSKRDTPAFTTKVRLRYQTSYVVQDPIMPSMWLGAGVRTLRNLDLGVATVLTRNRISDVRNDGGQITSLRASPSPHVPKFYAQWKTKDLHVVAGTYTIGFGQRLTYDDTSRYTPNGIVIDDKIDSKSELSARCRESEAGDHDTVGNPCYQESFPKVTPTRAQCQDELNDGDPLSAECACQLYGDCAGVDFSDKYRRDEQSPDYSWSDRLRGAAVGVRKLGLGPGWLQLYTWGSLQTRDIYQYEIYDRANPACVDPEDDTDANKCGAPSVTIRDEDAEEEWRIKYTTLPNMFHELLGGANATYFFERRSHIGVTGYGADIMWALEGIDLDFQDWSRWPYGGAYGAVGIDATWGVDWFDLGAEVARSFDGQQAGGGFAGILRATGTWKKRELEAVLRYYDTNYANPHAGPVAADDEYDGLRARDEAGLRLKYSATHGDLMLRATGDFWAQLSSIPSLPGATPKLLLRARADYDVDVLIRPGIELEFKDKDLTDASKDNCYETKYEEGPEGEDLPCRGERIKASAQVKLTPTRELSLTAKYQHSFLDDRAYVTDDAGRRLDAQGRVLERDGDAYRIVNEGGGLGDVADPVFRTRQDVSAWLIAMYKPIEDLRLRARARFLFEDISDSARKEKFFQAYVEGAYWWDRDVRLQLRYMYQQFLDSRDNTKYLYPNPAHWVRMQVEVRL